MTVHVMNHATWSKRRLVEFDMHSGIRVTAKYWNVFVILVSFHRQLLEQEQWNRALAVDPEFVFVTGWNEWSAGSKRMGADVSKELASWDFFPGAKLSRAGHPLKPGDLYFIDEYNEEFSRDIEPMQGGHTDDYYYQLIANMTNRSLAVDDTIPRSLSALLIR